MTRKERIEIAKKISEKVGGKVWAPELAHKNSPFVVRIYLTKGYVSVREDGIIDIDRVGRASFSFVKDEIKKLGYDPIRVK